MTDPVAALLVEGQEPPEFAFAPVDRSRRPALAHFATRPSTHPVGARMDHQGTSGTDAPEEWVRLEALLAADTINETRQRAFQRITTHLFNTELLRRGRPEVSISLYATQNLLGFCATTAKGEVVLPRLDEIVWTGLRPETGIDPATRCLAIYDRDGTPPAQSAHERLARLAHHKPELAMIIAAAGFQANLPVRFA